MGLSDDLGAEREGDYRFFVCLGICGEREAREREVCI